MRYLIRRLRRPAAAHRSLAVAILTFAFVPACSRDDPFPTSPSTASPATPGVTILGATITDLSFTPAAINESGQVVGGRYIWTPGAGVQDLGTLGGTSTDAYAINNLGQVAGTSSTATGERHAFLWTPGQGMRDLGTLGGGSSSTARGVNDQGQVVGEVTLPPVGPLRPAKHAFLWTPGQGMQDLGTLGSLGSTIAFDINNAGQVVGRAFSADQVVSPPTDPELFSRAFLWAPGQGMRDLGDLGGGHSIAYAINDAGQVVGRSWLATVIPEYGIPYRAFLWTSDDGMRNLGSLETGPSASAGYGINEAGQVVGMTDAGPYFLGNGPLQAFLWTAADGMEAITPTTGIHWARGINDRQQVIGDSRVATLQLAPGNTPPVAVPGGPYSGVEGSPVSLALSATDIDDVGFELFVSFGDGNQQPFDMMFPVRTHTYADNGTYTLTLTVVDRRGARDTKTTTVTIANVAPTILAGSLTGPPTPIQMAGGVASAPIALEFTDPAGENDTYAVEITCGNGVVLTATQISYTGKGAHTGLCTYTSPGVYTVRATVSDEDGGVSVPAFYRYVVVFDPEGAFTTGAGFYGVAGQGKTKAHFSFTVKFPAGQSVPNGTAKLWVAGGSMEFESTAIEMLVASGSRAQFWGTGTLNGAAARFRITAVDGQSAGAGRTLDAFRIEIWQSGVLVLDTQPGAAQDAPVTTPIEGGSIQVHGR
jgi:probable HAF family extracellular repeat protein